MLSSYRNLSTDLLCKSIDWFPYDGNTGISWVKSRKLFSNLTLFVGSNNISISLDCLSNNFFTKRSAQNHCPM